MSSTIELQILQLENKIERLILQKEFYEKILNKTGKIQEIKEKQN